MSAPRSLLGRLRQQLVGLVRNPDIQMIRDLIYLGLGQVGVKLVGFVVYAYLARILSTSDYGALESVLAVVGLLAIVVDFGLGAAGVRYRALHAGKPEADVVVGVVLALRLIFSVCCAAVLMIGVAVFLPDPQIVMLAGFLAVSLILAAGGQEWLLQSLEQMRDVALAQFLRTAFLAIAVLLTVHETEDVAWFGFAEAVSVLMSGAFMIYAVRRSGVRLHLSLRGDVVRPMLKLAAPLGLNALLWGGVQSLPVIIVGSFAGLEAAAYFATAQRLVTSVQALSFIYHFNMYPALTRRYLEGPEALVKLSLASLRLVAWACIGPAILVALHAGGVMALLFGESFREAGGVLAILIFAIPIQILSGHHRWALTAAGKNGKVLVSGIAGFSVAVGGSLILTIPYGAIGGAIGMVLATLTIWAVAIIFCRHAGFSIPILRRLAVPTAIGLVGVAVGHLLPFGTVVELITFVTIYVVLGLIVDQRRIYSDFRHLAYSKKIRRAATEVVD